MPLDTPWRRFHAHADMLIRDGGLWRVLLPKRYRVGDNLYRSAQPTPGQLARLARRGLRTVVSLRGTRVRPGTLALEIEACERLGLAFVDLPMDSRDAPKPEVVDRVARLFREAEYPMLVHCSAGADRVGLFAALYLLMHEGRPVEEAARQLSWRFGHVRLARSGLLDHFLESYRTHNAATPTPFDDWVARHYDRTAVRHSFRSRFWADVLMDRVLMRE